ncbi:MAG: 16S rRNA (guanine(966)-N(2))-methyltransferase RsmD [Lachnospiraceae bacterium]
MRVIAGSAKRLQLKAIEGIETRPTTDRIKETLFNIIAPEMADCIFLDLFSGSGGIGIEALSRGAKEAVFVEKNPRACACIKENLMFTRFWDQAELMTTDAVTALRKLEKTKEFDYIFMDPPYGQGMERAVLEYLADSTLLAEEGLIIVEAIKSEDFSYLPLLGFSVIKIKEYKTNKHVFIERKGEKEIC